MYMYGIVKLDREKEELTQKLSDQYSQNILNVEEYERILEYINKIETKKEITIISQIIQGNENSELMPAENETAVTQQTKEKHVSTDHVSAFSWRTTNVKPINGNGGKYVSLFGANRIIVDNLPKGRTIINVNSIFGLTEIIVSKNIKVINKTTPLFSGIFGPNETNNEGNDLPELYITGKAVFGNITIIVQ